MNWRAVAVLILLGFVIPITVAKFQAFPGYLDSDYYFAGGVQLASGRGFTEPYLWNYLDDPQGLPHPSHTYWMPLASIISAVGMWVTGQRTYASGRLGFIALASLVPAATGLLAYSVSHRRDLALISGLLGVFSIYYAPFLPVTDNYDAYLILGAGFFLVLSWRANYAFLALGFLSGLFTLARSDGILWLGLIVVLVISRAARQVAAALSRPQPDRRGRYIAAGALGSAAIQVLLACLGFALVTAPWFWRTYTLYGTPLAPGGAHVLWLRNYDETFSYPASHLTFDAWLAQGWSGILSARLGALRWNLLNAFAAQGGIVLSPFILIALWQYRSDVRIQAGVLGWLALLLIMTVVFPFAGARGGFFHAGAGFQSLWWTLAPMGMEAAVGAARARGLFTPAAGRIFQGALVGLAALLTGLIIAIRVLPGWGEGEQAYPAIEAFLQRAGIQPGDVVMVRNPPGYYMMTGRPAIVIPYADRDAILAAALRYHAAYLIIEAAGAAGPIQSVYRDTQDGNLRYVTDLNGARIYRIQP